MIKGLHKQAGLYLPPIGSILVVIALWYVVSVFLPYYVLPSPIAVWNALLSPSINWAFQTWATLYETLMGFALSVAIGIPLAIVLVYSKWLNRTIYPIILALQIVPKIAVAPILFIILGFSDAPRIITVFLVGFFVIVADTVVGLNSLDPSYVDLFRILGASKMRIFLGARLPNAMPNVFNGLKVSMTLSVIGAVVAEFVAANAGLGYILISALAQLGTTIAFASLVLLTFVGLVLYLALEMVEYVTIPWYRHSKHLQT